MTATAGGGLEVAVRRRPRASLALGKPVPRWVFWTMVLFLFLEYVRPPVLPQLRIQMLLIFVFPVLWFRQRERPWTSILTTQLIFLLWCAKAIPISTNNYAAYMMTRAMWGYLSISLAFTWICSNLRDFRRLVWIWVAIMSYQAIFAVTHGGGGTGGFLGDENDLALGCGTAFPLAFFGFDRLKGRARWLSLGAAALLVSAIVASFSRGGFVGLVVSLLYCLVASKNRFGNIAVLVAALAIAPAVLPPKYVDEIRSISDTHKGTAEGRRFLWAAAFNMFKANPILGVGGGNTSFLLGKYQTEWGDTEYDERNWSGVTVHSLYFQLLPEQGIPGVIMFISMLTLHYRTSRRIRALATRVPRGLRDELELYVSGINGALLGYLGAGAFISVLYYPYVWYFTALMATLELATQVHIRRLRLARVRGAGKSRPLELLGEAAGI